MISKLNECGYEITKTTNKGWNVTIFNDDGTETKCIVKNLSRFLPKERSTIR